jgi:N-acetylneuraminate synthase/sialic acid synthase
MTGASYYIAEVGQNHQGDLQTALDYVRIFADVGANALKFQARSNKVLFDEKSYNAIYNSENAFGDTYGEHREFLELSKSQLIMIRDECHKHNTHFMCTPFDEESLSMLVDINVDILKISSFDIGNLPFISKIAMTKIPVVMSVGGGKEIHIERSVNGILAHHDDITLLHCVSEYPCSHDRLGLSAIQDLIKKFNGINIGVSDHFNGILSGPVAYMMGASVFEKHVTTNRSQKGTDHCFALEPEGFRKFVRDINRVPEMMHKKPQEELGAEKVFKKLGKSIVAARDIHPGEILDLDNLSGKIFSETHVPVRESYRMIGCKAKEFIKIGEPIIFEQLTE